MTAMPTRTESADPVSHPANQNRTLTIAVVLLALLTVILGVLLWNERSAQSVMPTEVAEVVEDSLNAIVVQDADAWRATVTDDYVNKQYTWGSVTHELFGDWNREETADTRANRLAVYPAAAYEQIGDPFVAGEGPWFVTVAQSWRLVDGEIGWDGVSSYVIVERDGVMRIDKEYWVGTAKLIED